MRRAALDIPLFLLLGTILNIVIAWGCERYFSIRVVDTNLIARERRTLFAREESPAGNPEHRWVMDAYTTIGSEILRYAATDLQTEVRRSGWPLRSLACTVEYRSDSLSHWTKSIRSGIPISGFNFLSRDVPGMGTATGMQGIERVLPLQPLWIGFLLDSLFWAMALWLLWMTPRWLRSGLWGFRRKCMQCGYPVGVSPVCTECGRPLSRFERRSKNPSASALNP